MTELKLSKPHIIAVVGIPGAGKSFFAEKFSDTFNAPYLNYNEFKRIAGPDAGIALADHTFKQLLRTKQSIILEGRGGTIVDRRELIKTVHKLGYDTLFVWAQTEPATAQFRSVSSKTATLSQDEFMERAREFENLQKTEHYAVISGKHTYPSQAKTVLRKLVTERPPMSKVTVRNADTDRQVPPRNHRIVR